MKYKFFLLAFCCLTNFSVHSKSSDNTVFIKSNLNIDFKITHKISHANLLGLLAKQLIVFGENKNNQKILAIYELLKEEHIYSEVSRIVVPNKFLAFDILKSSKQDKLLFQTNQDLIEYLAAENKFQPFAKSHSIYLQDETSYLVEKDFIKDINGDGLDDIVIAGFKGVHFSFQNKQGDFVEQTINIKPQMQTEQESASYRETELFYADLNQDNQPDLIHVLDQSFEVYYQNQQGLFADQASLLKLPMDIKALDWWQLKQSDGESMDQSQISHRTVHLIQDINNDAISDIVVLFNQTNGVLDRKNNYEIYLGKADNGIVGYSEKPNSVIKSDGTIADFKLKDLDADDRSEIIVTSLDIGLSQIIGALISGHIDQDVYFFKMDSNDQFSKKAISEKEVQLNFSLSSGKSDDPVIKVADFNGDGFQDLMLSDGKKILQLFFGDNNKKLFDQRPINYPVQLPENGRLLEVADLNQDGKADIIIRYGRQDDKNLQNQLVILFAN